MSEIKSPRVRFAPSPTGQLHLGGVRTALFNFLFARHHQGKFYLRIEDTDRERSKEEFVVQILEALKWMGLDWDAEPVFQSERQGIYQQVVDTLLINNSAYRCFCSKSVLEQSKNEGAFKYPGTCRDLTDDQIARRLNSGVDFVVRLIIPAGTTAFNDIIFGPVTVSNSEIDDFIIARSDGSAIYNLTVVADDHEMGITHIIRGEDHLSNTPKQIQLYRALNYSIPAFAHLPMILGPDKKRLSKRHGAPGIQEYKNDGNLPVALLNGLLLLGWNPGSEQEIFTLDEMIREFSLEKVNKKGAVYDAVKFSWICGQHIMRMGTARLLEGIHTLDQNWGKGFETSYVYTVLELLKPRSKSLQDFIAQSAYFFTDPMEYERKAADQNWSSQDITDIVKSFINALTEVNSWKHDIIESALRKTAESFQISAGKLIHPTRLAISGVSAGPSLFAIMELIGKTTCLSRLNKAIEIFPLHE